MTRNAYLLYAGNDGTLMVASCASLEGFSSTQTGPLRGSVEWAKEYLVREGIISKRASLKRMSAKTIARIVEEWADAQDQYDNHECARYDDY